MNYPYIIIDDDQESVLKTKAIAEGFSELVFVASANNYSDGLNLILEHNPKLIFLEIDPANKASNLSLALINELYRYLKVIPKIVITTGKKELAFDAIQYEVSDFLIKPVQRIDFIKLILKIKKSVVEEVSSFVVEKPVVTQPQIPTTNFQETTVAEEALMPAENLMLADTIAPEAAPIVEETVVPDDNLISEEFPTVEATPIAEETIIPDDTIIPEEFPTVVATPIVEATVMQAEDPTVEATAIVEEPIIPDETPAVEGALTVDEMVEPQETTIPEIVVQQSAPFVEQPLILCIKSYGDYRYIDANDICYFQADNNSTDIHLNNGEMVTAFKTLKHFEGVLPYPFARIHNSYIVNRDYISRIHTGNAVCYIKNSTTKLPFSKSYKENVDVIISDFANGNYLEI